MSQNLEILEKVIRNSLIGFADSIEKNWVWGKEREAVSIFAFDHLLPCSLKEKILERNSQIQIESRVPQIKPYKKKEVCKDLVIWPKPFMNCWIAEKKSGHYPLCVMEWKVGKEFFHEYDIGWLIEFSKQVEPFIGFAIIINFRKRAFILKAAKIINGRVDKDWLLITHTKS